MRQLLAVFFALLLTQVSGATTAAELRSQAQALKKRGDAKGALEAYRRAAALEPASAELEDEIGFLYAVLKQTDDAKQHFRKAVQLQPSLGQAWYHLGV